MAVSLSYQTFRTFSQEQQLLLVWHKGTFLTCRQEGTLTVGLYHLGPFFCEVYYAGETNEIQHLLPFTNRQGLEAYLDLITLPDLSDLKT